MPTAEVATLFGCSVRTVSRWAAAGSLPVAAKTPGKHGALLFDRAVVEWFAKQIPPKRSRPRPPSAAGTRGVE